MQIKLRRRLSTRICGVLIKSVRDNLEAFSVSNGFYFLLDIAMQGMQGTSEDPSEAL